MKTKTKTKNRSTSSKKRTAFALVAPEAKTVSLAGDFNQWRTDTHPMRKGKNGKWSKSIYLAPGTYEYKYCVDGRWTIDEANANIRPNCFGTRNNMVVIASR